jgi:hypothetical protein
MPKIHAENFHSYCTICESFLPRKFLVILQYYNKCTYQDIVRLNVLVYNYGVMGVHMMYGLCYFHSNMKRLIHRKL